MLDQAGYSVYFENGNGVIIDADKRELLKVRGSNGLYTFIVQDEELKHDLLWHRRMGHVNFKQPNELRNYADGIPKFRTTNESCDTFIEIRLPENQYTRKYNQHMTIMSLDKCLMLI